VNNFAAGSQLSQMKIAQSKRTQRICFFFFLAEFFMQLGADPRRGSDKAVAAAAAVKKLFYALNEKYCCATLISLGRTSATNPVARFLFQLVTLCVCLFVFRGPGELLGQQGRLAQFH
jgi:hypothetical protein